MKTAKLVQETQTQLAGIRGLIAAPVYELSEPLEGLTIFDREGGRENGRPFLTNFVTVKTKRCAESLIEMISPPEAWTGRETVIFGLHDNYLFDENRNEDQAGINVDDASLTAAQVLESYGYTIVDGPAVSFGVTTQEQPTAA